MVAMGTVICGTMREVDLIPAFENALAENNVPFNRPEAVDKLLDGEELTDDEMYEVMYYLNEDLWESLNDIAPDGCYFGSHPGDGCDYGFWKCEDY